MGSYVASLQEATSMDKTLREDNTVQRTEVEIFAELETLCAFGIISFDTAASSVSETWILTMRAPASCEVKSRH